MGGEGGGGGGLEFVMIKDYYVDLNSTGDKSRNGNQVFFDKIEILTFSKTPKTVLLIFQQPNIA